VERLNGENKKEDLGLFKITDRNRLSPDSAVGPVLFKCTQLEDENKLTAGIIAMPLNDQSVFNIKYISNEPALGKDEVYYCVKGNTTKLKMLRVTNEVTV